MTIAGLKEDCVTNRAACRKKVKSYIGDASNKEEEE